MRARLAGTFRDMKLLSGPAAPVKGSTDKRSRTKHDSLTNAVTTAPRDITKWNTPTRKKKLMSRNQSSFPLCLNHPFFFSKEEIIFSTASARIPLLLLCLLFSLVNRYARRRRWRRFICCWRFVAFNWIAIC